MVNESLRTHLADRNCRIIAIEKDPHNQDYEGCSITLEEGIDVYRKARKTPTKKGYFLAMWRKDSNQKNCPFSESDSWNHLIVEIEAGSYTGFFLFPKEPLISHGILTSKHHKGKMAFRVYTPYDTDLNQTALKTQAWQAPYFRLI